MKIIAINGSPRGTHGATWWVLERFLQGASEAGANVATIHLAGKRIHYCTGEFACWLKTPGQCIHNDDMEEVWAAAKDLDRLVLATPVYVDGMTGLLKNCLDRMLPGADPHFELRDGHCRHPSRTRLCDAVALVSVCGFPERDNFDPLVAHVKAVCANMNATYAGAVLRPAGPMFPEMPTISPLFFKIRAITQAIRQTGKEFAEQGKIADTTANAAAAEIISQERYVAEVNKWADGERNK